MRRKFFLLLVTDYWLLVTFIGCGPSYPETRVKESIIKICKKEYGLDVKVATVGKTITIYLPLTQLIDFTFAITKEASEKINDVILTAARVTLSTDAKVDFYCIIAHDVRIPEIQIVIVKYVDDVKRFLLNDISRGEYSKRMLVDIRLSPQAQKERAIKDVFSKMKLDEKWEDQVMNEFFRAEPTGLGEMGYWEGRFYIKDVTLAEFLAEQTANRIKMEFKEDRFLSDNFLMKSAKGTYVSKEDERYFRFDVSAAPNGEAVEMSAQELQNKVNQAALRIAYQVLHGYRFEDFNYVLVVDITDDRATKVLKEDLKNFRSKNAKLDGAMEVEIY